MENLRIYFLDKTNAAPFALYLLPEVRDDIAAGRDVIALGAASETHTLGALAATVQGGTMSLLCLYVDPAVRRQGIGSTLLCVLGTLLREQGVQVREVLTHFMEEDEDTAAITAFARRMGLMNTEIYNRLYSVDTALLHDVPGFCDALSDHFVDDPHVLPYAAITPEQLREIEADESVLDCLKPSAMTHGILAEGSTIWVEDGHVLGLLLVYQGFDGEIVLSIAVKRDGAPKGCFNRLMLSMAHRCYTLLGRDFMTYISPINTHASDLVQSLTGHNFREHKSYYVSSGETLPFWLTGEETAE